MPAKKKHVDRKQHAQHVHHDIEEMWVENRGTAVEDPTLNSIHFGLYSTGGGDEIANCHDHSIFLPARIRRDTGSFSFSSGLVLGLDRFRCTHTGFTPIQELERKDPQKSRFVDWLVG